MFSKADIEKYFIAEKQESLFFLIIGIVAILLAIWFYFLLKPGFYRGAAVPLLIIGIVQLAVGYTVFKRSDGDRVNIVYAYDMDRGKLKNEELPRMKTVNRNFIIYRWMEIVLLLAGVLLAACFRQNAMQSWWMGFGVALGIQAMVMLAADLVAEKRAREYAKGLERFVSSPAETGNGKQ